MNIGLFCFYEDYDRDYAKTLARQTALVQHAEGLGFEEAWVAEHHFNDFGVSPSLLMLLAHLAGITTRIRLGSAALLLPFHDPIKLAEDIATLDHLSGGRLNLGVAAGGPFPLQNRHFKVPADTARERLLEALTVITRLLYEGEVSHGGTYFQLDAVNLQPKPLQQPIPLSLATQSTEGVDYAARHGYGHMGGQATALARLQASLHHYRAINPTHSQPLSLLRSFFVAKTRKAALEVAEPAIQRFRERMRPQFGGATVSSSNTAPTSNPFLDNGVIGDVAECREQIQRLREELDLRSLVLKPVAIDADAARYSLSLFNDDVRPYI